MKLSKLLLSTIFVLCQLVTFAQDNTHLKLSNRNPKTGETVAFTYNPDGTILEGRPIQATIYFLDNDSFPVADAALAKDGKLLKGEFTIPDHTGAFCIKLFDGEIADNNNGNGYLYLVYDHSMPAKGAFAGIAYATGLGSDLFGIKKNMEAAASWYKKEFNLHPDIEKDYEDLFLSTLFYSNAADRQLAGNRAIALAQSGMEQNMLWALNYYRHNRNAKQADSLLSVIKNRFSDGIESQIELATTFDNERDVKKKDSLYKVLKTKYPANDKAAATQLDYKRIQLALSHLGEDDMNGFAKWEERVNYKFGLPAGIFNIISTWAQNGERLNDAEKAIKRALTLLDSLYKSGTSRRYLSPKQTKEDNRETYHQCADSYAFILYRENKYKEALSYEQAVYDHEKIQNVDIATHYAMILNANCLYTQTLNIIEKCFAAGISSPALKDELEKAFIKTNGSNKGFDVFLNSLDQSAGKQRLAAMARTMINIPAPAFKLKDLAGKQVSLASLKGKVVVVDFWANWCAPCKESFPGMQSVIQQYHCDQDVVFVFIDTWENGSDYVTVTKNYLNTSQYNFNVLFDEKAADGRLSKIRLAYEVNSLPTKVIIDKNGNIRFKADGYPGSSQAVADEVSTMIELTKKS